jgi:hypothetical protein
MPKACTVRRARNSGQNAKRGVANRSDGSQRYSTFGRARARPADLAARARRRGDRMKLPRRQFLHLAAGAAALPALSRFAWAQAYPVRPIMIVDTFPPGGSTGIIARIIADKFSETLGQQVIVDQRAGAGGTVAAKQIARSTPDGYTIMLGFTGTLGIAPSLYPNVGYDPRKDFAPVLSPSAPVALRIRQRRLLCDHQERLPRLGQERDAGGQFADTLALARMPRGENHGKQRPA